MNILNQNIQKYMPEILETVIEVYGEKNEELIRNHEQKIIYTKYLSPETALEYYKFLKTCKANELVIKYLKRIGVLEKHFELKKLYSLTPKKIAYLSKQYLGSTNSTQVFTEKINNNRSICSFLEIQTEEEKNNGYYQAAKELEQISYLNCLRNNKKPLINLNNYEEFKKTDEYTRLYQQIMLYIPIYQELNTEFRNYLKEIEYLKDFYNSEKEKQKLLYQLKMLKVYKSTKNSFPENISKILAEKFPDINERVKFLLNFDQNDKSSIESFSSQSNEDLKSSNVSDHEKNFILMNRINFFRGLGIDIDIFSYKDYENIIKREDVKALIPNEELANEIIFYKNSEKKDFEKAIVYDNPYFDNSVDVICNSLISSSNKDYLSFKVSVKEILFNHISKNTSCVFYPLISEAGKGNKRVPILLQLITSNDNAQLDYVFIHELIHALEVNSQGSVCLSGFDSVDEKQENPYNNKYRLYERLNETIVDIIAEKIRKVLMKKGIYIAENKNSTDTKMMKNRNSDNLLKIMLYPLFEKVGQEILDARISGEIESFYSLIGYENFINLNDAINKVDYLIQAKKLKQKLREKAYQDPIVLEYYLELDKVNKIYEDIDNRLLEKNKTYNNEYKKKLL